MMKSIYIGITGLLLASCVSTKEYYNFNETLIDDPKIIAIKGKRYPWFFEIEKRLKAEGFKVKRFAVDSKVIEDENSTVSKIYNRATTRYILSIDGYAPNNSMTRCFGGGYNFNYINVEMIDSLLNETIMHYSNTGYSEGCPPLSGSIFSDISEAVTSLWAR